MNKILTYKGAVMTWECDSNGHMNVMYYINKFEHAGRGLSLEMELHDEHDKEIGSVVLEQTIKYFKEVFEDDLLYIESSLIKVGNKALTIKHVMYNARNKMKVAEMDLVIVLFDKIQRKAVPIPKEKRIRLEERIS